RYFQALDAAREAKFQRELAGVPHLVIPWENGLEDYLGDSHNVYYVKSRIWICPYFVSISTYPRSLFHKTPFAEESALLALHPHTFPQVDLSRISVSVSDALEAG
ncbi:MAG: hypothetical protein ACRER8_23345, partial [Pseudomonas sp.]|uniref:hypothetical protein n=1 Tax=Pseudomonas sp. TaxID=306 RepID=UPI003D6DFC59